MANDMKDRRPENRELRDAIEQHDEGIAGTHQYDEIVPIARMWLNDPVSLVRRGVESGTIKGEVVEVSRMEADASGRVLLVTDQAGTFIVIGPVSDGESET